MTTIDELRNKKRALKVGAFVLNYEHAEGSQIEVLKEVHSESLHQAHQIHLDVEGMIDEVLRNDVPDLERISARFHSRFEFGVLQDSTGG